MDLASGARDLHFRCGRWLGGNVGEAKIVTANHAPLLLRGGAFLCFWLDLVREIQGNATLY